MLVGFWLPMRICSTYLNTFAFLATSLCMCTAAGAIIVLYYQPVDRDESDGEERGEVSYEAQAIRHRAATRRPADDDDHALVFRPCSTPRINLVWYSLKHPSDAASGPRTEQLTECSGIRSVADSSQANSESQTREDQSKGKRKILILYFTDISRCGNTNAHCASR